jgi:hypothetical protein
VAAPGRGEWRRRVGGCGEGGGAEQEQLQQQQEEEEEGAEEGGEERVSERIWMRAEDNNGETGEREKRPREGEEGERRRQRERDAERLIQLQLQLKQVKGARLVLSSCSASCSLFSLFFGLIQVQFQARLMTARIGC